MLCNLCHFQYLCNDGCVDISGLAINWEDEIVYWSDMNLGHIMYSKLDGRYHAFLLTGLVKPKALAIDPTDGSVTDFLAPDYCCNLL